ncbi:unnamed protein product [Pleuronectes platessa]|uniref:Uncharacterized protein n=1 Tax=Pleuronectes platessa TaxID=8262 RepID=A0A9N7ZCN5_PLEPL|nr:unnamed protein product [Pleuronectes platessa]
MKLVEVTETLPGRPPSSWSPADHRRWEASCDEAAYRRQRAEVTASRGNGSGFLFVLDGEELGVARPLASNGRSRSAASSFCFHSSETFHIWMHGPTQSKDGRHVNSPRSEARAARWPPPPYSSSSNDNSATLPPVRRRWHVPPRQLQSKHNPPVELAEAHVGGECLPCARQSDWSPCRSRDSVEQSSSSSRRIPGTD